MDRSRKLIIHDRLSLSTIDARCRRKNEKSFNLTMLNEREREKCLDLIILTNCSRRRERECLFLFIFDFSLSLFPSRSFVDRQEKRERYKGLMMLFIYRTRGFFFRQTQNERRYVLRYLSVFLPLIRCNKSSGSVMITLLLYPFFSLSLSPCFF